MIDSPGFDDGTLIDTLVLERIAAYINTTYKLKQTLAGVLYLHDITKQRMGTAGQRNLRVLENMIGIDKWDNCTFVTTKWGCLKDGIGEEEREQTLKGDDKFFGAMLKSSRHAEMVRFDPKSQGRAIEIIKPHLRKRFDPLISQQMVDPRGPKLALGETDAGRIVADDLEKLKLLEEYAEDVKKSQRILEQRFDEKLFEDFKAKRDKMIRKHRLQKAGRWATRTIIVGGAIAATVLTLGPGASVFVLEPAFEKAASQQRLQEQRAMERLKKDFKEESTMGFQLKESDPAWLLDKKVKRLQDLNGEGYSIRNRSSTEVARSEKSDEEDEELEDLEDLGELGALGELGSLALEEK